MGSRFRKEITAIPSVRIRVQSRGLTTVIGWGGNASTNVRLDRSLRHIGDPRLAGPLPTDRFLIAGTLKEYGGGRVSDMTSPGLDSFKELLLATRQRRREIEADIRQAKWQLRLAWAGRALGWASLACAIPSIRMRANNALTVRRSEVETLVSNLDATRVSVNFDMESEIAEPHTRMRASFDEMATSQRSWSIQTEQNIDRVKARSWAGTVVSRTPTALGRFAASLVDTQDPPLALSVLRGRSTAYFYPGFILVDNNQDTDFALIDITKLEVVSVLTNFTETDAPPSDAQCVGTTWAKANKNGSRDRRFANNRELPILRYGSLHISCTGGLNEAFMFSNAEVSSRFASAVAEVKRVLAKGRQRADLPENQKLLDRKP